MGRYNLQTNLAKFKNSSPTCYLCLDEDEDLTHFLLRCPKLQHTTPGYLHQLKDFLTVALGSAETDKLMDDRTKLVQVIMDMSKILCTQTYPKETIRAIETMSRNLCYALHSARATLLRQYEDAMDTSTTKKLKTKNTGDVTTSHEDGCTLP